MILAGGEPDIHLSSDCEHHCIEFPVLKKKKKRISFNKRCKKHKIVGNEIFGNVGNAHAETAFVGNLVEKYFQLQSS